MYYRVKWNSDLFVGMVFMFVICCIGVPFFILYPEDDPKSAMTLFVMVIGVPGCLITAIIQGIYEWHYASCMNKGTVKEAVVTDMIERSAGRRGGWRVNHFIVVSYDGDDGRTYESCILVNETVVHSNTIGSKLNVHVYGKYAAL